MWADGFELTRKTGWVPTARRLLSPNWNARPKDALISLVVVHGISLPPGEFGGSYIDDLFLNRLDPQAHPAFGDIAVLKVSSHLLLNRQGELTQYVPLHGRAWHAGTSAFAGVPNCNDYSVGIELEGTDELPYEDVQYLRLGKLINLLMSCYPAICSERVVGHSAIAPGRKTDPGPAFEWEKLWVAMGNPLES